MSLVSCDGRQRRSHPLAAGAHHKHGPAALDSHHVNGRDEIGIIGDDNGGVERFLPRVVEEVYRLKPST